MQLSDQHRQTVVSLSANGRILIPAFLRQSLNLSEGDRFVIHTDKHSNISLTQLHDQIEEAEGLFADFAPAHGSVADELIAERRQEAAQEAAKECNAP